MATEIQMPKVGLTMTEGKVVEWKKGVGDRVEKGELLFVFETEKTTFDVEAPADGYLARIVADVEDTVPVGAVVALLTAEKGQPIDGPAPAAAPPSPPPPLAPPAPGGRLIPVTGVRRITAERMAASRREAAQAEMTVTLDAAALLAARQAHRARIEGQTGARLTITDLVHRVTVAALAHHPLLNSRWTTEGILQLDALHLGFALALDDGLLVPVIRDAARLGLGDLARARADLAARGRAGKLTPDELRGSTFTVSSLGMLGVEQFNAILNPPEAAILAVGAIRDRPAALAGQVVVRPQMTVTLSYDHRVVDGAVAARFLQTLRQLAESPEAVLG